MKLMKSEALTETVKSLVFRHTKLGAPKYPYQIEPIQLATLINEIERLKAVPGQILEIGVARGMTTRFMAEHLVRQGYDTTIHAVDTFGSFTATDLAYETEVRGKNALHMMPFTYNDFDAWKRNFENLPVVPLQADCATVDYGRFGKIKLAFLDVDLYLPTKNTLPKLYDVLVPGGTILVDDVQQNNSWDGSYMAYMEFCETLGVAPEVIGNKCGAIRKPATQ